MTETELGSLSDFGVLQHDPDDVLPTQIVAGIPGAVNRHVAEAPYAIAVGVIELHQYAGVSGGHKAVSVGCGGRATIAALHHRDRIMREGVQIGRLSGNPFRAEVDALGVAAGCRLALVYVPAVHMWLFGSPEDVVEDAMRRMNPWYSVSQRADGAVLQVDPAKAVSLYQASRAASYLALSPCPPLNDGATLVLRAACPEGLGSERGFTDALSAYAPPWQELLTGEPPQGPGAQRAVILAMLSRRYRLRVEGCVEPARLQSVGIDASADCSDHPPTWLRVPHPFQRLPQLDFPRQAASG